MNIPKKNEDKNARGGGENFSIFFNNEKIDK
jgi:hypothetical protein